MLTSERSLWLTGFFPDQTARGGLDEAAQRALHTAYAELMAAHRICSPIPPLLLPKVNADGSIDPQPTHAALQQWIERFHITGFPIRFLGVDGQGWQGDPLGTDRGRNVRYLRSMYTYLRAHHWDKIAYIYVADEPSSQEAYDDVRARSKFVHEVVPGLKVLCTKGPQVQNPSWGSLVGWVDIWVPLWPTLEDAAVKKRLSVWAKRYGPIRRCAPGSQGHTVLGIGLPNFELSYPDVDQLAFRHYRLTLLEYHELGFYAGRLDLPPDLPGSIQHGRLAVVSGSGCGCALGAVPQGVMKHQTTAFS